MKFLKLFSILLILPITLIYAQDESDVEEVVVVGSQIKGAKITGALPVTVITSEDIEAIHLRQRWMNGSRKTNRTEESSDPSTSTR